MPLCVGCHLAVRVFPLGITWESCLKPLGPDVIWRALASVWSYGEVLALRLHSDPDSAPRCHHHHVRHRSEPR
jgi:hypothetical protein